MILNMPGKRPENLKELLRYINLLEEQLRFILGNIDGSDISPGTIGSDQLADGVVTATHIAAESITVEKISPGTGSALDISSNKSITLAAKKLEEAGDAIAQLVIETDKISTKVADAEGNVSELQQTAKGLESRVKDTEGNITTLQQTAQGLEIRAESAEETLEGLGTRVTEAEASLTVQAGQIAAKAEKTTVNDLAGRVTEAEADLTVQAGEIAARAKQTDLDKLSGRVTEAEASLTVQAGQISLKASKTEVKDAVDDIEIGGRNLLKNSKGDFRLYPANTGADGDKFVAWPFYFKPTLGETYTFGADVEITDGDFDAISIYPYPGGTLVNVPIPANGRITHTFTVTVDTITQILAYAGVAGETRGNGVIFRNVKIEKGNKATDWTAAPEDLESRVLNAETAITQTAEQISLKASKTEVTSAIDAIQVGGTNLFPNSKGPIYANGDNGYSGYSGYFEFLGDYQGTYTLSADITKAVDDTATNTRIAIRIRHTDGTDVSAETTYDTTGEERDGVTRKKTVTVSSTPGKTVKAIFGYLLDYSTFTTVRNAWAENVKLERGNKATDWSPAPEDIEERVSKAEAEIAVQAGEIAMRVKVGDSVETLENSAMTLNGNGIEMSTTGHFRLYANDGKNSRIKLGGDDETANFSVDETGKLGAVSGAFANGLTVGGQGVWTRGNIIISSSQPTNVHDVLWLKPLQGVEQVHHSFLNTSQGYWVHDENYNYTLPPQSSDVLTPGGSYTYSLILQMAKGGSGKGIKSYTMQATLSTSAGSVTLTSPAFTLNDWGNAQVTLTATSATNLFAASGNVNAAISVKAPETGNTYLYVKNNTEITLTSKNTAASSAGAQTCTIHYIQ